MSKEEGDPKKQEKRKKDLYSDVSVSDDENHDQGGKPDDSQGKGYGQGNSFIAEDLAELKKTVKAMSSSYLTTRKMETYVDECIKEQCSTTQRSISQIRSRLDKSSFGMDDESLIRGRDPITTKQFKDLLSKSKAIIEVGALHEDVKLEVQDLRRDLKK